MQDFKSLKVWEKSHQLALAIYRVTRAFPKHELFGLTNQIRRAGVSIPANIAEGCGRGSDPEFARFLQIAMGSASEVQYHLLLSKDLDYLKPSDHDTLESEVVQVKRMLATFIQKLKADSR